MYLFKKMQSFLKSWILLLSICLIFIIPIETWAQTRIIKGRQVNPNDWPWMAAIIYTHTPAIDGQFCGGTLIHPAWILTGAHCTDGETIYSIEVLLGRNTLSEEKVGETIGVKRIIKHPSYDYDPENPTADIALLQLEKPYTQAAILRVANSYDDSAKVGTTATVIGWGRTDPHMSNSYADSLQQTSLPIVANDVCNKPLSYNGDVKKSMLCAGFAEGGTDACIGDSGGPLIAKAGDQWQQIGIVSWGEGCAQPYYYGVYTRVSSYQSFIMKHICQPKEIPSAPQLTVSMKQYDIKISWNSVIEAEGYQFYYAPYSNPLGEVTLNNIQSFDIGQQTEVFGHLNDGDHLYVAVQAYRGNCYSNYSNLGTIQLNE